MHYFCEIIFWIVDSISSMNYTKWHRGHKMQMVQDDMMEATNSINFWSEFGNLDMRIEPFTKDVLAKLRKEKGIKSQRELAELSGIPESTIKKLEAGSTKQPSYETLMVLGRFFDLFFYVDWTEKRPPGESDGN